MSDWKVVFGIGNPGREYANTRHNLGFRVIDHLAQICQVANWFNRCHGLVAETQMQDTRLLLCKPLTYVNRSGDCAQALYEKYYFLAESFLVVVDDVALPLGQIRLRRQGSSGSHKGIESLINRLNSDQFPRLRLGIGVETRGDLAAYVLSKFSKEEEVAVAWMVQACAQVVNTWIEQGIEAAMNRHNNLQYQA